MHCIQEQLGPKAPATTYSANNAQGQHVIEQFTLLTSWLADAAINMQVSNSQLMEQNVLLQSQLHK